MESKHTQSDWRTYLDAKGNIIIEGLRPVTLHISPTSTTDEDLEFAIAIIEDKNGVSKEINEANAKLISCAPDMAKMLFDEIKLLDRFMKMLPGKGIMWHEMKERKKFIKIVLDKATL